MATERREGGGGEGREGREGIQCHSVTKS